MAGSKLTLPADWHNHAGYRAIFSAALTGIIANPGFFGPIHQGEPASAVEFAMDVLSAALAAQQKEEDPNA